ncbi:MAG: hypothetical protein E5X48_12995 [Mesorhizobium sp.]|nr:MAG: hypothetical protein E5X48_12995 [Mesorhizobium sp.]
MAEPGRPPLRRASLATSPPIDGGEERREFANPGAPPLPSGGVDVRAWIPGSAKHAAIAEKPKHCYLPRHGRAFRRSGL